MVGLRQTSLTARLGTDQMQGTESDESYTVNTGNAEPHKGFGHLAISVDNIQAACKRLEDLGYAFQKKLSDGRMKVITAYFLLIVFTETSSTSLLSRIQMGKYL